MENGFFNLLHNLMDEKNIEEICNSLENKSEEDRKKPYIIEDFKINKNSLSDFKKLLSNNTSLRFISNPQEEKDYINLSFEIDFEEYLSLIRNCIKTGVYYYS
jgi:hypothetical protein